MSKCKLIINKMSGNCKKDADDDSFKSLLLENYTTVDTVYIERGNNIKMREEIDGYDALAVCGGDGTLNSAINAIEGTNIDLIYRPTGTLNDTAKSLRLAKKLSTGNRRIRRVDLGKIGDTMFAYVIAGGIFTPIGYRTEIKKKKKYKIGAYLSMVLSEYKIHHIKASVKIGEQTYCGEYALIMAINSRRCFGFGFNKKFRHNDGKAQFLLVKAPRGNGFLAKVKIFFPLFRIFFIGLRKEMHTKNITFVDFSKATLTLPEPYDFTVDGEHLHLEGENQLEILQQKLKLVVF